MRCNPQSGRLIAMAENLERVGRSRHRRCSPGRAHRLLHPRLSLFHSIEVPPQWFPQSPGTGYFRVGDIIDSPSSLRFLALTPYRLVPSDCCPSLAGRLCRQTLQCSQTPRHAAVRVARRHSKPFSRGIQTGRPYAIDGCSNNMLRMPSARHRRPWSGRGCFQA
jgi:hypothetical protein